MKKKIAFITAGYLPLPSVKGGAVETLTDLLIDSEKLQEKYDITVFSIYDDLAQKKSLEIPNVNFNYIRLSSPFNKLNKAFRYAINKYTGVYIGNDYINKLIKQYKNKLKEYDYVIVENKPEYGLILRKFVYGKLIFHSHNDFLNSKTKNSTEIFNSFDAIFCLSKFIFSRINQIQKSSKIKVLYNGVDVQRFNNVDDESCSFIKKKYNIEKNDIILLYTGRLVKEKGVEELIRAFNLTTNSKLKLMIIGSVGYGKNSKNNFTKKIYELSRENNNIIFTGFVEFNSIQNYYKIADYGIVPSIWEEPFALTVVEHLASGHPVIITNSGAMPELVNKETSIIVNKENLVNNLNTIFNKLEKSSKSNKYYENAMEFSKEKYINRFLELMEELQ